MKGVINMKPKMTDEQIKEVNELLEDYGDSLTAFYDDALRQGRIEGIIAGCLVGTIAVNICWVIKSIKNHKNIEE